MADAMVVVLSVAVVEGTGAVVVEQVETTRIGNILREEEKRGKEGDQSWVVQKKEEPSKDMKMKQASFDVKQGGRG